MKNWMAGALAAVMLTCGSFAGAEKAPDTWDGLVQVKPKRVDTAYVLPGADFSGYTKLMMDPVEVAFKKNWERDYNRDVAMLSQRLTDDHVEKIAQAARDAFTEAFTEEYAKAGLELVTEPGPGVLRLRPGVVNLVVTAPDTMSSGRSRTYTEESGSATLFLELRDAVHGTLLGRAMDARATRNTGRIQISNSVTNLADFKALFRQWAAISVKGFEELREMSPIPEDLEPGQKLKQ